MPSEYYLKSVELGRQFQKNNPEIWRGSDCKNYHNQIRYLMDKYNANTVLDYGCGKGRQYTDEVSYGLDEGGATEPMNFKTRINADDVFLYDPCVEGIDQLPPEGTKFDAVICTQVLGSIPDVDMRWLKNLLMSYPTKFCFIGLFDPSEPVKSKKRMYDSKYVSYDRTIEWYKEQFNPWQGSNLYWWFRNSNYPGNDWYPLNKGYVQDENRI
jgi:SAM-dependent methyltransferase